MSYEHSAFQQTWKEYLYGEQWRVQGNCTGLIPQLSKRVGLLKKVVHLMPEKKFKTICQGLFYSKLCYCLHVVGNVWGVDTTDEVNRRFSSFTKEDNRKLQTLQNKVLRLITGLPRLTPTEILLRKAGDLFVQQLTALSTLTSMQKIMHNGKPMYLANKLNRKMLNTRL